MPRAIALQRTDTALENITLARRRNVLALFQAFAGKALAAGGSPKGLEQAFAASLQISPSMWSQIKSARPIGDKLARQIEHLSGRPRAWLDQAREPGPPSPIEKAFMELALAAWRASSRAERKALRARLVAATEAEPTRTADRADPPDRGGRAPARESVT